MTGTCPMCNYSAPVQNSFKPNVMNEYYIPKTKEMVVLNDNEEELDHPTKGKMVRKDVHLKREHEAKTSPNKAATPPSTPVKTQTPPPPATIAAKPALIPSRPIPASAIKTPDEIAATPKSATVATPVVETPLVANIVSSTEGQP